MVLSANNDMLYTSALIDLLVEPVVLPESDVSDCYYSFMLVDVVTDNFDYVGACDNAVPPGLALDRASDAF